MDKLGARNVLYSLERKQGLQHLASAAQCDTFPRKVHNPVIFLLQMWTRQKSPRAPNRPSLLRVAPDAQHWRELPRPGPPAAQSIRADTGPPERTAELRTRRALPGDPRSPPRVPVHCARTRGPSGEGEDAVSTPAKSHRGSQPSLPGAERIRGTRGTPRVGTGLSPHGLLSPGAQPHPRAQRPPPFIPGAQPPLPRTRPHPRTQLPLVGRSLIPRHSPRSIAGRRLTPGRSPHSIVGRSLIPGRSSSQSAVPPPSRGAASFRGAASPQSAASPQGAVPPPSRGAASPRSAASPQNAVPLHPGAQPHPRAQSPLHSGAQHHPGRSPRPSPGAACSPAAQSIRRRRGAARRRPGAVRDAALSWGRRLPPRRPGPQPLRAPRRRFGVLREPHARPGLPTCPAALT